MIIRKTMAIALMAIGLTIMAAATPAVAQQQAGEEPSLVALSIDCRYQLRPAETTICSSPVLAAMDIQMMTLFNVLNLLANQEVAVVMASDQEAFLRVRSACASDAQCIGEAYALRISELDKILKDIASRGPY